MAQNKVTMDYMAEVILDRVKTGEPFAVARYGDGEYIAAHPLSDMQFSTYDIHVGYYPNLHERMNIAQNILNSIDGLDFIGVTKQGTGTWGQSREYFECYAKQPIVPLDFHHYFSVKGITTKILETTKKLLYISGHIINFNRFENIETIIHIDIPLQTCKYPEKRKYYPEYYDRTVKTIRGLDLRGYVCLVGAGFIGKPFMMELKNRGGIAIDLGSQMDRLAGYVIRGKSGKVATKDNEFKL